MSSVKTYVTCPHCNHTYPTAIWNYIDKKQNPIITHRIMNNSLFPRKCVNCGKSYDINHRTIFADTENETYICYAATLEEELQFREEHSDDIGIYRIVTDHNDFREKVRIFYMGFDDRVIELLKVIIVQKRTDEIGKFESPIDKILCWITDEKSFEFSFISNNEIIESATIPYTAYLNINQSLEELVDNVCGEDNTMDIDLDWAMQITSEYMMPDDDEYDDESDEEYDEKDFYFINGEDYIWVKVESDGEIFYCIWQSLNEAKEKRVALGDTVVFARDGDNYRLGTVLGICGRTGTFDLNSMYIADIYNEDDELN